MFVKTRVLCSFYEVFVFFFPAFFIELTWGFERQTIAPLQMLTRGVLLTILIIIDFEDQ